VDDYQTFFKLIVSIFSLLANQLEVNHQELVDLGHLKSLRVVAICIYMSYWEGDLWPEDDPPDIWTAFPWLFQVLKTVQKSNSIEEITIKVVHENSDEFGYLPPGFRGHFPWTKFEPLFTERFPCLRKVKLLLQGHNMPVLRKITAIEHPLADHLLQRGILEVKPLDISGKYHFWVFLASSNTYWLADSSILSDDSWDSRSSGFVHFQDSF